MPVRPMPDFDQASRSASTLLFVLCAAATSLVPVSRVDAQKERAPTERLKAHTSYKHQSKAGLDYMYSVPKGFKKGECARLVVLCHGTGLDYRWGLANHAHKSLRPHDVLVSVSGPTAAQNGTRLFTGTKKDRKAFRAFLGEMNEAFGTSRVFLYGHSQGGFFVIDFAGAYPKDVAGAVAHASGFWAASATPKSLSETPLAFMHGSSDPVVPYRQSVGSHEVYAERGMTTQLRRLEFYNHWPNEYRTHEMIAWCDGMSCKTAEAALEAVREMLRPKSADRYRWQAPVAFGAARQVLRRFGKGGDFAKASAQVKIAKRWIDAIEAAGLQQVKALHKSMPTKKPFTIEKGKAWLGHFLGVRADFRGVDSVEEWLKKLGYEKTAKAHGKVAGKLLKTWYNEKSEKKLFQAFASKLPKALLYDGFPPEMLKKLEGIHKRGKSAGLGKRELAAGKFLERYRASLYDGAKAYAKVWKRWKLPK